jgi:hypothetical protein
MSAKRLALGAAAALFVTAGLCHGFEPLRPHYPAGAARHNPCSMPVYEVCKGCFQSTFKPPSVHPHVPFGYYETTWSPWPLAPYKPPRVTKAEPPLAPPDRPTEPEVEPLPPPRPHDKQPGPKSETTGPTEPQF